MRKLASADSSVLSVATEGARMEDRNAMLAMASMEMGCGFGGRESVEVRSEQSLEFRDILGEMARAPPSSAV